MNTAVHNETAECGAAGVHCYSHNRDEADGAQACGECYHSWPTDADLLADHNRVAVEHGFSPAAFLAEVFVCPFCAHDL